MEGENEEKCESFEEELTSDQEDKVRKTILKDCGINVEDLNELQKKKIGDFDQEIGVLWHKRLGHASLGYLLKACKFMPELKRVKFTKELLKCEECILPKQVRNACKDVRERAKKGFIVI